MLDKLRQIIKRYGFPPELIGKAEVMACDIYDFCKTGRIPVDTAKNISTETSDGCVEISPHKRSKINGLANIIRGANIGVKMFLPNSYYDGDRRNMSAVIHHSCHRAGVIKVRKAVNGYIIIKVKAL